MGRSRSSRQFDLGADGLRAPVRLLPATGGATAVEFAFVAVPFLLMFCGIVELGMMFSASVALENATTLASRTVRTGELQASGTATAANFKSSICNNMGVFAADCPSKLRVDVRTFASMSATSNQKAPITNGEWDTAAPSFNTGSAGDIVMVRAYYEWPLVAPGFDKALASLNGGRAVIMSAATFKNEPFNNN